MADVKTNLTPCMPDGTPAPYVMTSEDAARFMRIEGRDPKQTLRIYRERGVLRGTLISRQVRYTLPDIIEALETIARENPR